MFELSAEELEKTFEETLKTFTVLYNAEEKMTRRTDDGYSVSVVASGN